MFLKFSDDTKQHAPSYYAATRPTGRQITRELEGDQ